MADMTFAYPFDPKGTAQSNLIVNERHTLIPPADYLNYYFIVPKMAPFFRESLKVYRLPSGEILQEGKDYTVTHQFHDAVLATGKPIYGSITFYDRSLKGVISLDYQTLGGDWVVDADSAIEIAANTLANPRITQWEEVYDLPTRFPVIDHEWDLVDMVGMTDIKVGIDALAEAVASSGDGVGNSHITNTDNPHKVTKTQLGLGSVQNYGIATQQEAEEGTVNNKYMTALRTKNAIDAQVGSAITEHTTNEENPHHVTKEQIGLGQVENLPRATQEEAEEGLINESYLTPMSGKQQFTALNKANAEHIVAKGNPHGTTAADLNVYTKTEIDTRLENMDLSESTAYDAERFAGLTPLEWRAEFLDDEEFKLLITTTTSGFEEAYDATVSDAIPAVEEPTYSTTVVNVINVGHRHYAVVMDDGSVREVPEDGALPDDLTGITAVATGDNAYYTLNTDGGVSSYGSNAVTPPTDLGLVSALSAGRSHVLALLVDGTVLGWGLAGHETNWQIPTADNSNVVAMATGNSNNSLLLHGDGRLSGVGNANFITQVAALTGLTNISGMVMATNAFFLLFGDGSVRAWSVTDPDGAATLSEITLGAQFTDIFMLSGWSTHVMGITNAGQIVGWGDNSYDQLDVPDELGLIDTLAVGHEFTVGMDTTGLIRVWGRDDDNQLLPPDDIQSLT